MSAPISPELTRAAIDVAVMKKQKEAIEQQGQAAVALIDSAQMIQEPVRVAAPPGKGSLIDVYI